MEENNTNINETNMIEENSRHICFKNHCWKMCLAMVISAFLGGFLAIYFVTDQVMERSMHKHYRHMMLPPHKFERQMFNNIDREFRNDLKNFDKLFDKPFKMPNFVQPKFSISPFFITEDVDIESEFKNNNYNVSISLKPFQGDENKVNYIVAGRKLTVFGESMIKNDTTEQNISFSHDFILPNGADTMNIRKYKDGKKLIISIPVKANQ